MTKLSKTKSFSVSNEKLEVDFKGIKCEVANLLKSGIVNQSIILIAFKDVWHEINALDHGGDNSDLINFKSYVESMGLGLSDFGIIQVEAKKNTELAHDDFHALSVKFPDFNYIEISKLNDYNLKSIGRSSIDELIDWLKVCQRDKITISELITNREIEKQKILNMEPTLIIPEVLPTETVSITKIEPVTKIVLSTEIVPNTPIAPKKPISLQVFETLTPERIAELQGLNERQLQIVKENPIVKITDKESYETAKKTAAILLKASTAIDGTAGIEATATKYLNTFKSMLKNTLLPIAKLTRGPYDEQKQIINAWENAEEIKKQAEQRAILEKINKRTNELFAVPFTFNGSVYSIGNIYVVGSQIENLPDNEFAELVAKGLEVKKQLDAEAEQQKNKDAEIEALKAQLAALTNQAPENVNQAPTQAETHITQQTINTAPSSSNTAPPSYNTAQSQYLLPAQENVLLNALDLKNVEHLEKPAYIKCRGYYVQALVDVAVMVDKILNDATPGALKKSEQISNLVTILKQSK